MEILQPKELTSSKLLIREVFYNEKLVSLRGFKFSVDPLTAKANKNKSNLGKQDEIILPLSHKTPVTVFSKSSLEIEKGKFVEESKKKTGFIYKQTKKFAKEHSKVKKKFKRKFAIYKCKKQLKLPLHGKGITNTAQYGLLSNGKVAKKKEQQYRYIWMPVETNLFHKNKSMESSLRGRMEDGRRLGKGGLLLPKEDTPLVLTNRRLPLTQKIAYGLGHFYNDTCAAIWFTYALIFMQLVAEMGPVYAGFLLFIGQAVDAVMTPVAGVLLDKTLNKKTWHWMGSLLVLFSFPLIFTTPVSVMTSPVWLQMLYFSVSITIFQVGWAVVQIAHLSLLPELTALTDERAQLTGHRYTASMAAHIVVYFVTWALLNSSHGISMDLLGPEDSWRFLDLALLTSAIGVVATLVFHCCLNTRGVSARASCRTQEAGPRARWLEFFRSPHLYSVAIIYTSSRLFMTLSLVYMPLFINETILTQVGALATVPLASFLVSAFAALMVKLFCDYCGGLRTTYLIGSAFCLLGCLLVHYCCFSKSDDTSKVFGVAILFGAGSSITMVVSLCVTANLIGPDTECGAMVYSVVTTADKLLNGIAVVIIEELKCDKIGDCPYYYGEVLSYVNAGVVFCGLAAIFMLPHKLFSATNAG